MAVTYRRNELLRSTLLELRAQTRPPDLVLVVDNAADPHCESVVEGVPGLETQYEASPGNLGPAGGIALGMQRLLASAADEDWLLLIDDDDPPQDVTALADLLELAASVGHQGGPVGGVGLVGACFDRRHGRIAPLRDEQLNGVVDVDVIGGNQLPLYSAGAVRAVGVFDADLFFGFEELEYGLRLREAGYRLVVDGQVVRRQRARWRPRKNREGGSASSSLPWRDYYSLRNLLHLLVQRRAYPAVAAVVLRAGLLRPLSQLLLPDGPVRLRLQLRAVRDGLTGRLGSTVPPQAKYATHDRETSP